MDRYTVVGTHVHHSLSPRIHELFAEQTGRQLAYDYTLAADAEDFFRVCKSFFAHPDARGMNITMPFKPQALQMADSADTAAKEAGVANTLVRCANGTLRACNTDGSGLIIDLQRLGAPLENAKVLLLGAGGAARAVVAALAEAGANLHIANRTEAKAVQLAGRFAGATAGGLDRLPETADLVINATGSGHDGGALPLPNTLLSGAFCYDLSYAQASLAFVRLCVDAGAKCVHDGLGMLVEQAADAFAIWHGTRPHTPPVLVQLRQEGAGQ